MYLASNYLSRNVTKCTPLPHRRNDYMNAFSETFYLNSKAIISCNCYSVIADISWEPLREMFHATAFCKQDKEIVTDMQIDSTESWKLEL